MEFEVDEKRGIKARTRLIDALFVNVRPTVTPPFFFFYLQTPATRTNFNILVFV